MPIHCAFGGIRFAAGPGGEGKFRGGDGVIREIRFSFASKVSLLSDRRRFAPYGLNGGDPEKRAAAR